MVTTIKKVKPMFNGLITTMHRYKDDQTIAGSSLVDAQRVAGTIKEYQTVVAVGPSVRGIEVGDTVFINPSRYAKKMHQEGSLKDGVISDNPVVRYDFRVININGEPHLYLYDNDIEYIAEVEEFEENPSLVTEEAVRPAILTDVSTSGKSKSKILN